MPELADQIAQAIGQPAPEATPAPVAPAPEPTPAQPAAPDPYAQYLAGLAPELQPLARPALEAARKAWEAESADKFQMAEKMQGLGQAMTANPRGTIAFIAQQYNLPVQFNDETPASPGRQAPPIAPAAMESESIKRELMSISRDDPDAIPKQIDAIDRLSKANAREAAAARVGTLEQAQLTLMEQERLRQLKSDYPDIDVDRLYPQLRRQQQSIQERPYIAPDEALAITMFKPLYNEVRRLRGQLQRPAANELRAQVAGPNVSTPAAAPLDLNDLTVEQLRALLPNR